MHICQAQESVKMLPSTRPFHYAAMMVCLNTSAKRQATTTVMQFQPIHVEQCAPCSANLVICLKQNTC